MSALREYVKLRYMGDCKCGDCHLVPVKILFEQDAKFDELVSTLQFLLEILEFECVQRGTDMTSPPTPASAIGRARAILAAVGQRHD